MIKKQFVYKQPSSPCPQGAADLWHMFLIGSWSFPVGLLQPPEPPVGQCPHNSPFLPVLRSHSLTRALQSCIPRYYRDQSLDSHNFGGNPN